ncbi:hypothetical protein [Streptomyces guryensis]|uniref:Uncharacterized protein n=1 Tax=Streptomyces guryensis TaxID=2886947 RepID=A0A9Q3VJM8_9ACTN|nr:hypothetical protein [Streptomyces guryensis]MCD9873391.1 hypothetical protein [Streptomyces guryensis]
MFNQFGSEIQSGSRLAAVVVGIMVAWSLPSAGLTARSRPGALFMAWQKELPGDGTVPRSGVTAVYSPPLPGAPATVTGCSVGQCRKPGPVAASGPLDTDGKSGLREALGTKAGRAFFRPDVLFAPVCCFPPSPHADSGGVIAAAPATAAARPAKVLRSNSSLMAAALLLPGVEALHLAGNVNDMFLAEQEGERGETLHSPSD